MRMYQNDCIKINSPFKVRNLFVFPDIDRESIVASWGFVWQILYLLTGISEFTGELAEKAKLCKTVQFHSIDEKLECKLGTTLLWLALANFMICIQLKSSWLSPFVVV